MKKQKGFTIVELMLAVLILGGTAGWIWNIVKIFSGIADPLTLKMILRCIGIIVAPLGAILGYL